LLSLNFDAISSYYGGFCHLIVFSFSNLLYQQGNRCTRKHGCRSGYRRACL